MFKDYISCINAKSTKRDACISSSVSFGEGCNSGLVKLLSFLVACIHSLCLHAVGCQVHVVYRTSQQEHEFGWPYALGHHEYASKPADAMMKSLHVVPGDTIVMGSDGLFDNVFVTQIVEQVSLSRQEGKGPQALVQKLTEMAHISSLETHEETPYSRGYSEAFDLAMSGGKPDDITVLVAHIS